MVEFREPGFHAWGRRIGEFFVVLFAPLIVTFLIVYAFPDQYRWLVEATQPFSMYVVTNLLRVLDTLPFVATNDEARSAHAMEIAFSGDNLFGCYVGLIVGAGLSWFFALRTRLARRLTRGDKQRSPQLGK